jgi:DNA-binding MarR family transcriptional regulator
MTDNSPEYLPSLGRVLGFAAHGCSALSKRELAHHGLTLAHWVLLTALWRQDGMTVGELARYYKSDNTVLTRTLDRMAERGLIERRPDPEDRRAVRVHLTEEAKGLSHLVDFYKDINQALLEGFSEQEQHLLFALLERVIANTGEALGAEPRPRNPRKTPEQ